HDGRRDGLCGLLAHHRRAGGLDALDRRARDLGRAPATRPLGRALGRALQPRGPLAVERRSGFTMIELMISVAVLGIVSVYMFESFAKNQQAYTVIDQLSESQQNLRAI